MHRLVEAAVLLCSAITPVISASEPPRPRGVGPEFAKFYKAADGFTCISNPSVHLSIAQVNDDYCDCPDGSDEPGTSACSTLSPLSPSTPSENFGQDNVTIALPGYYCKNKGHQPSYIPFTYVNDGICDYELCCDGSDEWEGVGGIQCEDHCEGIGKEWKKQDEHRQRALGAANKRRRELVAEAQRLRKEVEDRIKTLRTEVEGLELRVTGLEKELADVERRERGKVVRASAKGGKIGVLTGLARERIAELRETLLRVRRERDASRDRVKELEGILSTFKEDYNPNFNDEGVKRAVRSWEDYAAREKVSEVDTAHERDLDEMLGSDSENGIDWEEFEGDEDTDVDVRKCAYKAVQPSNMDVAEIEAVYQFEAYLPKPLREWVDTKLRELRVMLIENGILAGTSTESSESKAVTDARGRLNAAQNDVRNSRDELQKHEDDLAKDYGPADIFRALKGRCVSQDSGEYTYELCWMDRTTQKPKKGGAHTGMGNFARIDRIMVDEDLPANGKGLGSGERLALKYENGQHCWNGPNRSTTVILACAEEDEIWRIVEEEKCVYRMEVGTPAVCEAGAQPAAAGRDEL